MMSFSSCLCAADAAPRPPAGSAYPHPTHHSIAQDLASTISPWFLFCLREERMDSSSVRPQLHLIWSEQICCQLPLCSVQGQGSMICDRRERCCRGIRRVCHQWWGSPLLLYPRGGLTFDALALLRRPQGVRGNASQVLHSFPGTMLKLEDVVE